MGITAAIREARNRVVVFKNSDRQWIVAMWEPENDWWRHCGPMNMARLSEFR